MLVVDGGEEGRLRLLVDDSVTAGRSRKGGPSRTTTLSGDQGSEAYEGNEKVQEEEMQLR